MTALADELMKCHHESSESVMNVPNPPLEPPNRYRFGSFELVRDPLQLWREGEEVKVGGTDLGVLLILLDHCGEVVTRETILQQGWGEDAQLNLNRVDRSVSTLRKILDDPARKSTIIKTLSGRGYQFMPSALSSAGFPSVEEPAIPIAPAAPRSTRRWGRTLLIGGIVLAVCAALAFRHMGKPAVAPRVSVSTQLPVEPVRRGQVVVVRVSNDAETPVGDITMIIEGYDDTSGTARQVFRRHIGPVSFGPNQKRDFPVPMTMLPGQVRLTIGIFGKDKSHRLMWLENLRTLVVR